MYPRTIIINDVTAKWCKIFGEAQMNTFGSKVWEMQIQTTDANKAKEIAGYGLKCKESEENGQKVYSFGLKRKGLKRDGSDNSPVNVVAADLSKMEDRIGNGSTVNVNLWQYEYEFGGRKGVGTSLTGVQVTNLVKYEGSSNKTGFSVVGEEPKQMDIEAAAKSPF